MTKKAKVEQFDGLQRKYDLTVMALQKALRGEIEWFHKTEPDASGAYYEYGVTELDAADGGLFFQKFVCPATGQKDSFEVSYVDDVIEQAKAERAYVSEWWLAIAPAIAAIQVKRMVMRAAG